MRSSPARRANVTRFLMFVLDLLLPPVIIAQAIVEPALLESRRTWVETREQQQSCHTSLVVSLLICLMPVAGFWQRKDQNKVLRERRELKR